MADWLNLAGRLLMAVLFAAGAAQKIADPGRVRHMLGMAGLSGLPVRPLALFTLLAAGGLVFGPGVRPLALALYCLATGWFHWQLRADPWQASIVVKNWAVAGGLLVLAAQGPGRFALRIRRRLRS